MYILKCLLELPLSVMEHLAENGSEMLLRGMQKKLIFYYCDTGRHRQAKLNQGKTRISCNIISLLKCQYKIKKNNTSDESRKLQKCNYLVLPQSRAYLHYFIFLLLCALINFHIEFSTTTSKQQVYLKFYRCHLLDMFTYFGLHLEIDLSILKKIVNPSGDHSCEAFIGSNKI